MDISKYSKKKKKENTRKKNWPLSKELKRHLRQCFFCLMYLVKSKGRCTIQIYLSKENYFYIMDFLYLNEKSSIIDKSNLWIHRQLGLAILSSPFYHFIVPTKNFSIAFKPAIPSYFSFIKLKTNSLRLQCLFSFNWNVLLIVFGDGLYPTWCKSILNILQNKRDKKYKI